jgi:hypothetical protein
VKTKRPLGTIRPLATMFGRARRRWRGGPLVPMIWRRPLRARLVPVPNMTRPAPSAPAHGFNLILVWPAGTAARAGPMRRSDTRTHEVIHMGRDAGPRGTNRLVTLVELLWLRSNKDSPPRESGTPEAWVAPSRQVTDLAPPAGTAPRVWPRANKIGARDADVQAGGAPRLQPRVPAIRHGQEARVSRPVTRIGEATAAMVPVRPVAAMTWRGAPPPAEAPAADVRRPSRPRAALVWRSGTDSGASLAASPSPAYGRRPSADLVWRSPAAGTDQEEGGAPHRARAATVNDSEIRADRPLAPAPPRPAAPPAAPIQPAEMSRLVDEVVRRLDRIGRDERMRRGI